MKEREALGWWFPASAIGFHYPVRLQTYTTKTGPSIAARAGGRAGVTAGGTTRRRFDGRRYASHATTTFAAAQAPHARVMSEHGSHRGVAELAALLAELGVHETLVPGMSRARIVAQFVREELGQGGFLLVVLVDAVRAAGSAEGGLVGASLQARGEVVGVEEMSHVSGHVTAVGVPVLLEAIEERSLVGSIFAANVAASKDHVRVGIRLGCTVAFDVADLKLGTKRRGLEEEGCFSDGRLDRLFGLGGAAESFTEGAIVGNSDLNGRRKSLTGHYSVGMTTTSSRFIREELLEAAD